jgi:hypothetical protein
MPTDIDTATPQCSLETLIATAAKHWPTGVVIVNSASGGIHTRTLGEIASMRCNPPLPGDYHIVFSSLNLFDSWYQDPAMTTVTNIATVVIDKKTLILMAGNDEQSKVELAEIMGPMAGKQKNC